MVGVSLKFQHKNSDKEVIDGLRGSVRELFLTVKGPWAKWSKS
jgi:hypothetical protein